MADSKVLEAVKVELKDAAKFVFFDEQGTILASNVTVRGCGRQMLGESD